MFDSRNLLSGKRKYLGGLIITLVYLCNLRGFQYDRQ